ncbi:4-hydroxyproline epimerase [Flagellimonas sp. DF-77]|uniref:4-hydroxyproline epimerase n=1 Tax=Flagellimonas algarum TaxID=3230298 RepID=UPI003391E06D
MAASVFECLDGHTCGNPVRLVAKGGPDLIGNDMSEKRQYFMQHYDWIRKGLMYEPRGHDMMSGSILYPPHDKENDVAVLFIETSGCLPMCGHGTIGTITMAIENDLITPKVKGQVRLETPAGLVIIAYHRPERKVEWVRLTNVKSYLAAEALEIHSPHLGPVTFDVAYGGNFYAIIDPQTNFGGLQHHTAAELIQYSQKLRDLINERYPDRFIHPENDTINGVSHMLWTGSVLDERSSGRNAVFYGDKAIDRSPCGTGTSARMAQLHAKGLLRPKEAYIHESYIGSTFIGRVEETTTIGTHPAIIPSVQGWAKAYGRNTITIDPEDDPFAYGFQVI